MEPRTGVRYPLLPGLRVLAVVAVLFSHSFAIAHGHEADEPLRRVLGPGSTAGLYGVYTLFVLSGFLLAGSLSTGADFKRYVLRRAVRIFPTLAIAVLLTAAVVGASFTADPLAAYFADSRTWSYALRTLALQDTSDQGLPGVVFSANDFGRIVNGVVWTLAPLVLFSLGLAALSLARLLRWWVLLVLTAVGVWTHLHPEAPLVDARFLLPFFAAGAFWGVLRPHLHYHPHRRWSLAALCVAGFAAGVWVDYATAAFAVFGSGLVVVAATARACAGGAPAAAVSATFLMYLLSWPAEQAVRRLAGDGVTWSLVFVAGTVAAGCIAWSARRVAGRLLTRQAPEDEEEPPVCGESQHVDVLPGRPAVGRRLLSSRWLISLTVLAVLLAGAAVFAVLRDGDQGGPVTTPPREAQQVLVVSGSSLTAGEGDTGQEVADALGDGEARVVPGAGFARNVRRGALPLVVALREMNDLHQFDVIVVQGGEADHASPAAELRVAALHLIDYLRAQAPDADLVLVGPVPARHPAPDSFRAVRDVLQRAAADRQVPFVDSLAQGWTDSDPDLDSELARSVRHAAKE